MVRGRCLPYGEGITYWPVVEVVKQLAALPSDPVAAAAIRSLLGESERARARRRSPGRSGSCSRSRRRWWSCFDDIQWGEETFLDLVERRRCSRRTRRSCFSAWRGRSCSSADLPGRRRCGCEPLAAEEADALIGDAVPPSCASGSRARPAAIRCSSRRCWRWPRASGEVDVPPTLRALLAARLDQLDPPERRVLERGRSRARSSIAAPCRHWRRRRAQVTARLASLVRHELVRPDRAQLAGRGRLPLPPPADPRHRLRRAPQGDAGRAARTVRRLARRARRSSSSWTRSSATTSSRPSPTGPSSASPTGAGRARRRAARSGRAARS